MGEEKGWNVFGLEFAFRQHAYPWKSKESDVPKITLFPHKILEDVSSLEYIDRTWKILDRTQPDAIAICGYDTPATITALVWAKIKRKIAVLMSDSKEDDLPRNRWKEGLKRLIISWFDGALVGGEPQREYVVSLGLPKDRVLPGYDVVDNDFYTLWARRTRLNEYHVRSKLGLPTPFFLTVSRFIEKKNLFRLIEAYKQYRKKCCFLPWDLVMCGTGDLEKALHEKAIDIPGIHFPGVKQANELSEYYGLAGCFILPSSHFEQWGLVVNEAMAAELPVLVSRACGCARDLVRDGVNGFTFDPFKVEELADLMLKMSSGQIDLVKMGKASLNIITGWGPSLFAENLFKLIKAAQQDKLKKD